METQSSSQHLKLFLLPNGGETSYYTVYNRLRAKLHSSEVETVLYDKTEAFLQLFNSPQSFSHLEATRMGKCKRHSYCIVGKV